MQRKQSGFTIVELVVVIILLGILAATALPRFIDIDDDAHTAVFEGVAGSLQTGIALFHARAVASDAEANDTFADFGGMYTNADGFPYGLTDNSSGSSTVTTAQDCVDVFTNVHQAGAPTIAAASSTSDVKDATTDFAAVVNGVNCEYYHSGHSTNVGEEIGMLIYDSVSGEVLAGDFTVIN